MTLTLTLAHWNDYYLQFERQAAHITLAADALHSLTTQFERLPQTAERIRAIERDGDDLTRALLTRVERAQLAHPRDEYRDIIRALDDVLDAIQATADAFDLCGITEPTAPAIELIEVATECARHVERAVGSLRKAPRRTARLALLRPILTEINRIDNLSDQMYREAMGALFRQPDVALMLKWKQVYDTLEVITDRCDDVGDALQTAVLRRA